MGSYSDNTPAIHDLAQKMISNSMIDTSLYSKYNVKRGLRDLDGKGVLTGLTDISTIIQNKEVDGKLVPCDGELYYRGYNVNDIVGGILEDDRFGFEEVVYLLLFGEMPNVAQLKDFKDLLVKYRTLPQNFVRDVILKAPSEDMMNSIARSVLTLFCYDDNPNDTSVDNVLRQCIQLISVFPMLSVTVIMHITTISVTKAFIFTVQSLLCPQRRLFCHYFVLTENTHRLRQKFLIWRLFFIWSTAAVTTLHLQLML